MRSGVSCVGASRCGIDLPTYSWLVGGVTYRLSVCLLWALLSGPACRAWPDPTSQSVGDANHGLVHRPAVLASTGPGWVVPPQWHDRGFLYGTEELVGALRRAAETMEQRFETGFPLAIADLSARRGGPSRWHRSHQSGRDVDLIFYSVDTRGRSLAPPQTDMVAYDGDGAARDGSPRYFDWARNWALIEALLSDPTIRVQWVFVSEALRQRLLLHAETVGRPAWVRAYAARLMWQPSDSAPHDDHFHVRVYCSRGDRHLGCVDKGPVWQHEKKTHKYPGPEVFDPVTWRRLARGASTIEPF